MLSQSSEPVGPAVAAGPKRERVLLQNVSFLSGSLLVTSLVTLVWTLFVPRRIGPHGMGLIVMAWTVTNIMGAVWSLGMRTLLVREIAADPRRAPSLVGTAMIVRIGCILPCLAMAALYVSLGHFDREHALVLYMATGVGVCVLLSDPILAAFQAIERMQYLAYADVLNKTLLSACGIALVVIGFGATALVALMFVAAAVVLAGTVLWSRRHFAIDWRLDRSRIRALVAESLPYWSYALFYNFYVWVDSAMLAVMAPTEVVGWYGGPTKLLGSLMFVPVILSTAWLPRLVAAFGDGTAGLKQVARVPTEQIMVLSLPITVGAALIAGPLIHVLYGAAFAPSVPVFIILVLTVIPTYFNIATYQILVACKRQATWTAVLGLSCVINPALNLLLIPQFQLRLHNGAIGAALSLLLTELIQNGIGLVMVHAFLHRETLFRLGRSAVATLGMAAVVVAAGHLGVAIQVLTGSLTFIVLAIVLGVASADELQQVKRLLSRWSIPARLRRLLAW
jgi:O-antigen/teichoic acid export membrane protein